MNSSTRGKNEILTPSDKIAALNDKRELSEIEVDDGIAVMFPKMSEKYVNKDITVLSRGNLASLEENSLLLPRYMFTVETGNIYIW